MSDQVDQRQPQGAADSEASRLLERLRAGLADEYDVQQELGEGGMAFVYLAKDMDNMDMVMAMSMPMTESWGAVDFGLMLLMWVVMMVAMMVPTAAPMVLVFASVSRKRREEQRPYVPTSVFLLG